MQKYYQEIITAIQEQKTIIFFTGAGISVDSDIPAYRGKNGIWKKERQLLTMKNRKVLFSKLAEKYSDLKYNNSSLTPINLSIKGFN